MNKNVLKHPENQQNWVHKFPENRKYPENSHACMKNSNIQLRKTLGSYDPNYAKCE